ncbi:MAG: tetratricopeptide repeat protein [Brevundimonas sp.]|uniref:tetratricopeptide repeat protein n=1 Tax=Brevundimonas sp. TaxID=1871086 RepID=UPI003001A818
MTRRLGVILAVALGLGACEPSGGKAPPQPASLEDGDRCFAARDWTCAAANYGGYLRTYPEDPTVNARLALARTRSGKHQEALPAYRKAEELGVVTYDLYAGYATSLEATGDLEGAIRANRKSLEIVPNLVDVRGALAAQLVRSGQRDEAIALLEEFDAYLKDNGRPPYFTAQIASIREQG